VRHFSIDTIAPDVEARHPEMPWASLRPDAHPPSLVARARHFWSENAFNEWASAQAMSGVAATLDAVDVPEALRDEARSFAADEKTHVALCAGVARRLGGGVPIAYDPAALALPGGGTPFERATSTVLRVCCVGEAVAQPLLAGNLRATRQPLARAVLERIVRDETRHARFGWRYLAWAAPRFSIDDKSRLAREAAELLRPLVAGLDRVGAADDRDGAGLGWTAPSEWRRLARAAIEDVLLARLAEHGIAVALRG
jgi:hypothetical protein